MENTIPLQENPIVSITKSLKKTSIDVLREALPIMKVLLEDDNDLSDEIIHNLELPKEKLIAVNMYLRDYIENVISTAKLVRNEIDDFSESSIKGEEELEKNMKKYPMLAEVWYGDTYNKEGIPALKILLKELETDLSKINENKIIEHACKQKID